jgi:hypothetical protein
MYIYFNLVFEFPYTCIEDIRSFVQQWSEVDMHVQSTTSFVTFQGSIDIGSHKTGGHLKQV